LVIVALPALDEPKNSVKPPEPPAAPPLLVIIALPAFDTSWNCVESPLLMIVTLPALDAPKKNVEPAPVVPKSGGGNSLMIVCVLLDVFTMPAPVIVRVFPFVSIMNEFAPGSKFMPAAVMGEPRKTSPPPEPRKCASLPSVHGLFVFDVCEVLHIPNPENEAVVQVPPPAVAGVASSCQNRSAAPQAFGSMLKNIRVVMRPAKMPRRFLIDWTGNLIRSVFMGMAIDG